MPPLKNERREPTLVDRQSWSSRVGEQWSRFWFAAVDPSGLNGARVLVGALVLTWLLSFVGSQQEFFGMGGVFDARAYQETARMPIESSPLVGWSPLYALRTPLALNLFYAGSILASLLLTLGIATRITAPLTWLAVVGFTSNPALWFGGDALLLMLSFYVMVGSLLDGVDRIGQSPLAIFGSPEAPIWRMLAGKAEDRESTSTAANLTMRLMQVHLAIALFATGTHKLQMAVWWSGAALWFPLNPPLETTLSGVLSKYTAPSLLMSILSLAAYGMMIWQIGFIFYAWRPSWRPVVVGGAALGWLGNVFIFHLPLFGPTILIGALAFLPAEQWRAALDWIGRKTGLQSTSETADAPATPTIEPAQARSQHVA